MQPSINQVDKKELRNFGILFFVVFAALSFIFWRKCHVVAAGIFGVLSALMLILGLAAPLCLEHVHRRWMAIAHAIGTFNARVILSILYAILVVPISWIVKAVSDPLDIKEGQRETRWKKHPPMDRSLAMYYAQGLHHDKEKDASS